MANRPKKRIDYAGWSVDIFSNDTKIDKLLDMRGWKGFGVYFYLCQMAYGSEGYYYEWNYDLSATTARKMSGGISAETVKETVAYCLHIDLFNKELYDRYSVLTSRGIQKNYLVVLKNKNRKGTEIYKEYWLLDTSKIQDYQDVVFVSKNGGKLGVNINSLGVNSNSLGQEYSRVKDSKVKDSKEENISPPASGGASAREPKHRYGEYKHVLLTDKQIEKLKLDYGEEETLAAIRHLDEYIQLKGYKAKDHNLAMRKWVFDAVKEERERKARRSSNANTGNVNASQKMQLDYLLNKIKEEEP